MVDLDVIKKAGGTQERLKSIFDKKNKATTKTRDELVKRIRSRIQQGVEYNLTNYRYWYACDLAWDIPFQQTTATLMRGLINRDVKTPDVLKVLQGHDVTNMITIRDKSGKIVTDIGKDCVVEVHAPTFIQILFPLAKAYTTIRAAAIVNSYRQVPLFKYEPLKSTKTDRLKCDIITDRVELMSTQFGYADVLKQAVLHMLHYSQAVVFPVEEWYTEKQLHANNEEKIVKEGLRFHIPHPSRTFFDLAHRPSTMNCDTGVSFAGYWRINAYRDIRYQKSYWNLEEVTLGQTDYIAANPAFFNTVYSSCALRFPNLEDGDKRDRESRIERYTTELDDKAVLVTEYFEKLNPKQWDLFDYDYPIWMRFVVASDDTVLYCAPLPYCPPALFSYDALETRSHNASMTLECLPVQDHVNNLFSQYLLSIKQNLANVVFFDTNQVDKAIVDKIRNLGEDVYRDLNFVPRDARAHGRGENAVKDAFTSFKFPTQDVDHLIQGVNQLLNVLERVLVISPQELAQSASHELTAEEVRTMNSARSTRYEFTATAVDRGVYALKKTIYDGLMAYGTSDIYAGLPMPIDQATLDKLGFTAVDDDSMDGRLQVKGDKTALQLESFASTRDGDMRFNNTAAATAMAQMLGTVLSNEQLFAEIGVNGVIAFMNQIAQIAGLPRDFRFIPTGAVDQMRMQQGLMQQLTQLVDQIQAGTIEQMGKALTPLVEKVNTTAQEVDQVQEQLAELVSQLVPPPQPPPLYEHLEGPPNQPGGVPPEVLAQSAGGEGIPPGFAGPPGGIPAGPPV